MKAIIKRITALFCTAALLLSMSIAVFAAEGQKPVYEIDDKDNLLRVKSLLSNGKMNNEKDEKI